MRRNNTRRYRKRKQEKERIKIWQKYCSAIIADNITAIKKGMAS